MTKLNNIEQKLKANFENTDENKQKEFLNTIGASNYPYGRSEWLSHSAKGYRETI